LTGLVIFNILFIIFLSILGTIGFLSFIDNSGFLEFIREKSDYWLDFLLKKKIGYGLTKLRDFDKKRLLDYLVYRLRIVFAFLVIFISLRISFKGGIQELLAAFIILFSFLWLFLLILFLVTFSFYPLR